MLAALALLALPASALGASGDLDPTFGDAGKSTLNPGDGSAEAADVVVTDGGLVLAGRAQLTIGGALRDAIATVRLKGDGTPDAAYGGGSQTIVLPGDARATAIGRQGSGKLVVAGTAAAPGGDYSTSDIVLARLTAAGAIDDTFAGDQAGLRVDDLGPGSAEATSLVVLPDDRIAVAGHRQAPGEVMEAFVAVYTAAGAPDATFGTDGVAVLPNQTASTGTRALAVTADAAGRLLVAGSEGNAFRVDRRTASGTADVTWGTDGTVRTAFTAEAGASAVLVDGAGRVVAGGFAGGQWALVRYDATGTLDPAFGASGRLQHPVSGPGGVEDLALSGGALVASGTAGDAFGLARYTEAGSLDPAFGAGEDGKASVTWTGGGFAMALGVQPDGKLVVTGFAGSPFSFAATRHVVSGATSPPPDGDDTTAPVVSLTEPAAGAVVGQKPRFSGCAGAAPGDLAAVSVRVRRTTPPYDERTFTGTRAARAGCPGGQGWSAGPAGSEALTNGRYSAIARQLDEAGNTGASEPREFTVRRSPASTAAPTITGEARVGRQLRGTPGTWQPTVTPSAFAYGYHWQRCDAAGTGCADVMPADYGAGDPEAFSAIDLRRADAGHRFRLRVTATEQGGGAPGEAFSALSDVVAADPQPPRADLGRPPAVQGKPETGSGLVVGVGGWHGTGVPIERYTYRWHRCERASTSGTSGCTLIREGSFAHDAGLASLAQAGYVVQAADERHMLVVDVLAVNADGSSSQHHRVVQGPVKPKPVELPMPDVRGRWVGDAKAAVERALQHGSRTQIPLVETGVYRRAGAVDVPGRPRIGDVIDQSPAPGAKVVANADTLVPLELTYWLGEPGDDERCDKLLDQLDGADLDSALDVMSRMKCRLDDLRLNRSCKRKLDEPKVRRALIGRDGRLDVKANVPCRAEHQDLFGFLGYGARGLGKARGGAHPGTDFALTLGTRNVFGVRVVDRTGRRVSGARVWAEGAGIDATERTEEGIAVFSVTPGRAGVVDLLIEAEDAGGRSIFGFGRLRVREREHCSEFTTLTGERWRAVTTKNGTATAFAVGPGSPLGPCKKIVKAQASGLGGLLDAMLSIFGARRSDVRGGDDRAKLADLTGRGWQAVQGLFGDVAGNVGRTAQLLQAQAGQAWVISTGGLNLVAGSGQVIATGGGNLIGQAGGNLIGQAGGNLIGQAGGNLIGQAGGNLIGQAGGNLISEDGMGLQNGTGHLVQIPGGAAAIAPALGDVTPAAGARVISTGGGNVIATGGGNVIAVGGGN